MRRRSIVRDRVRLDALEQSGPPLSVREGVRRALALENAIESALKGGHCPTCGARFGRAVRTHFETCDGGPSEQSRHDGAPHSE
jgi:hypothetical protein